MLKRPSGNYDDDEDERPKSRRARAKKLAEDFSVREVGNLDAIDEFIAKAEGIVKWQDLEAFLKQNGWRYVETYKYPGPDDTVLYESLRYVYGKFRAKKKFILRHTNDEGVIVVNAGPVRVPYNLPELLARPDDDIELVEGEKAVEFLKKKGLLATCVQGQLWTDDVAGFFEGRNVNVNMDNDDAGRDSTAKAIERLTKAGAKAIRVPSLPGLGSRKGLDDWIADHSVEEYREIVARIPEPKPAFSFIDFSRWDSERAPEQKWAVPNRFPSENVSLYSGAGAMGKSYTLMQLGVASVFEREWLGTAVLGGHAMFIDCEDTEDVFHRRLDGILEYNSLRYANMIGRFHLESLAGKDAVLGAFNRRTSKIEPTALFHQLLEKAADIKPVTISISSASHVFAGNELDRSQVQQFVGLLQQIGIVSGAAVILSSHPSLTGISSGTGLSGSTQWHNAVRARAVLKGVGDDGAGIDDMTPKNDFRILEFYKNNYGPLTESIRLKFKDGLFVPVTVTEADQKARETQVEEAFLKVMLLLIGQGQVLAPGSSSPDSAAKKIAAHPSAVGFSKKDMEAAQQRLLDTDRIHIATEGPPSKPKKVLKPGLGTI